MIGITNGINKKSSDFETINVTLNTNQQSHADIVGVNFTLTYGNYTQTFAWKGSPLTIEVPAFVEYTLSFEGVEGYLKPADTNYTAQAENSRSVTFTYKTELVQVTVNSDNGASVSGAKVNINGKQQTWNGSVLTQKVPFGTSYTVSVGELSGFSTPASKSFKAEQAVREVSFIYIASALKVNILSNQSTESSWDPTITNVKATVTYGSTTLQVSNGQQINLPSGVNVTISFPEVEGYLKPDDIVFTHTGGMSEKSGTYKCELLTVNVSADSGTPTGFEVTISKLQTVGIATKYTKLEYIESNGTQYIDTGFAPTSKTRISYDLAYTSLVAQYSGLFYSGGSHLLFGLNNNLELYLGSTANTNLSKTTDRQVIVFDVPNKSVSVNGSNIVTGQSYVPRTETLPIFAMRQSSGIGNYSHFRLYSCQIYDNGTLIRDYIPALRSDGIAGLYDAVNDTFTVSSGSGNFIAGGEYKELIATQTSVTGSYKIPFNISYSVQASKVGGYDIPKQILRIANSKSYTASMQYMIIRVKDLSMMDIYGNPIAQSTANCYVIREVGQYKFPIVYGNAIKNGKVNTAAFTNNGGSNSHNFVNRLGNTITQPYIERDESISSQSVVLSNYDDDGVISDIQMVDGDSCKYIQFTVNSIPSQGANAIIRLNPIMTFWSWHIWLWPHDLTPVEITNSTGVKYNIMPVNLASKYDSDGVHIKNWFYQWGRKDPMLLPSSWNSTTDHTPGNIAKIAKADNIQSGILAPHQFYYNSASPYNWFGDKSYYNLWDAACTGTGNSDNDTVKTVYDPCPVGWKIPNGNTFTGLSVLSSANGIVKMRRYSGDTVGVGFPMSGFRSGSNGSLDNVGSYGCVCLSSSQSQSEAHYLFFYSGKVTPQNYIRRVHGLSVRPVQDDITKIDTI